MRLKNKRNGGLVTVPDEKDAAELLRWGWTVDEEPKKAPAKKAGKKSASGNADD